MTRCGSKDGYQKDMCLIDFGLHAQYKVTIQGSIINIILGGVGGGDSYDHLLSTRNFTLMMNKIYI